MSQLDECAVASARLARVLDDFDAAELRLMGLLATTPAMLLDPKLLAEAQAITATAANRLGEFLRKRGASNE